MLTHTFGSMRYPENVTVTGDSVFRIGSITKVFTDLMMYHLRDAGKIHLDDQVTELYPEYNPIPYPGR